MDFGKLVRRADGNKIFCIGFNKTGTSSLHALFQANGYSSQHDRLWPRESLHRNGWRYFRRACAYSDGEQADFEALASWFPEAVFLLNTRDETAWLRSRVKHAVSRENRREMAKEFFANERLAICKWIADRELYHTRARQFFDRKQNFLEVSVTDDPEWSQKVATLLSANGFAVTQKHPPHENRRDAKSVSDQGQLARYFDMIGECQGIIARVT